MKIKSYLLFTENFTKALEEIEAAGGHVTQKFTDIVFVADLPDGFAVKKLEYAATKSTDKLDDVSALMVKAWKGLQTKQRAAAKTPIEEPIPWDAEGFQHPRNPDNDEELRKEFEKLKKTLKITGTPTSETLTGSIALGLIIVIGTASGLGFSDAETRLVLQQVMEGCQFLASAYPPANVTFIYQPHILTIDAAPNAQCNSFESCEAVFRDPALVQLGYAKGLQGCVNFVEELRKKKKTRWAYMAFITKYKLAHFAYAGGVRICMQYANDGWGPNQISTVFAHETCHVFGAADEYRSSKCTCKKQGLNQVPNNNCENCSRLSVPESCLMLNNSLSLCPWSRGQIGWVDPTIHVGPFWAEYSAPKSYSSHHLLYRTGSNTLAEISYRHINQSWEYVDLNTTLPDAPLMQGENPFSLVYKSQFHNLYRDENNQISDILYDGTQWQYQKLNDKVGVKGKAPLAQGTPFCLDYFSQLHTMYWDENNKISDILSAGSWQYQNLNDKEGVKGKAPLANSANGTPFSVEYYEQHHTLYWDENKKISDILYNHHGGYWQYQNLNDSVTGAPLAKGRPFSVIYYNQHHTLYRDVNRKISDILYNPYGRYWQYQNLNDALKGKDKPPLASGDPFSVVYNKQHHTFYWAAGDTIEDIYWDGSNWQHLNLHNLIPAAPLVAYNPFSVVYNSQLHTFYKDVNNDISDIYFDGSTWQMRTWVV
jgi:hypothetical protein